MEFSYHMPVRVIAGEECVIKNAALFAHMGRRALIVTGKSSAKNGALGDVTGVLRANGQAYEIFDRVPPNPTVQSVREGAALARAFRADFVIAIGGGSPMDAAKAVAMLARQDAENIFAHAITQDVLPMIHIPTTAGTGSEVTQYSVLTNDDAQTKMSITAPSLFPAIAFLDGKYTKDLPQAITVNTAIDAVSHAVEGMLSVRANAVTDALAKAALKMLMGEYGCAKKGCDRIPRIEAALGCGLDAFSQKIGALLGEREQIAESELADFAARAANNRNVKNCAVFFNESELFGIMRASFR